MALRKLIALWLQIGRERWKTNRWLIWYFARSKHKSWDLLKGLAEWTEGRKETASRETPQAPRWQRLPPPQPLRRGFGPCRLSPCSLLCSMGKRGEGWCSRLQQVKTGIGRVVTGVGIATCSLHTKGEKFSCTVVFIVLKQPRLVHKHFFTPAPNSYICYLNKHLHVGEG